MADFFDILYSRRSIRLYKDESVPKETIDDLLKDAIQAATGSNMQPWEFVVITDKNFIREISDSCKRKILAQIEADPNSPWKRYEAAARNVDVNMFYNAPCLIYIVAPRSASLAIFDCSMAACNLMLSARARGLGTCWIGLAASPELEIRLKMDIPEDYRIVAPIIVGIPDQEPKAPARKPPVVRKFISPR
jgi:nitroreductase